MVSLSICYCIFIIYTLTVSIHQNVFQTKGMSISTVTAARIYKGQKFGKTGEEEQLTFDRFPYGALSRVIYANIMSKLINCSIVFFLLNV